MEQYGDEAMAYREAACCGGGWSAPPSPAHGIKDMAQQKLHERTLACGACRHAHARLHPATSAAATPPVQQPRRKVQANCRLVADLRQTCPKLPERQLAPHTDRKEGRVHAQNLLQVERLQGTHGRK